MGIYSWINSIFYNKNKNFKNDILNLILKIIGLTLIFMQLSYLTKILIFSFFTLIPVIVSSLIILGIQSDDFINKILVNKFIVFNGLLIFIIHLSSANFSFGRIFVNEIDVKYFLFLSLITYLFSFFIYRIIETPCRKINNKKFLNYTLVFILYSQFCQFWLQFS